MCNIVDFFGRRVLQSTLVKGPSEISALAMRDADPEPAGSGKIRQRRVVVQRHPCPPPRTCMDVQWGKPLYI